jgi:hypothetical protein
MAFADRESCWSSVRSRWSLAFVIVAFLVSRGTAYALGVRFNLGPLYCFAQYIDPKLLRTRLVESLFYFHSQPPLFNLMLGVFLRLPTRYFGPAMHALYSLLGLALAVGLYLLLIRLGIPRWPSSIIAAVLSATPTFILYENWLFYEYPVAALLVVSALALHAFLRRGTLWLGIVFFGLLAAVIYIRSVFQVVWLLLAIALLLIARPDLRRRVLAASAVPTLLVVLLLAKNWIVFGVPVTSSWFGMNLAQVAEAKLSLAERKKLVQRGELSRVSLVGPFAPPVDYLPLVGHQRRRGVPVVDELKKPTGCNITPSLSLRPWNLNNSVYIPASRAFFSDSLTVMRLRPGAYLRAIREGVGLYVRPFHGEGYVLQSQIHGYTTFVDRTLLLQIRAGQLAWTIVLAYIAALLYGLRLTYRLLLRRAEAAASVVTLAYMWLTVAYVTVVVNLTEIIENGRIRFVIDPLVVTLVAAAAHDLLPLARDAIRARRQGTNREIIS